MLGAKPGGHSTRGSNSAEMTTGLPASASLIIVFPSLDRIFTSASGQQEVANAAGATLAEARTDAKKRAAAAASATSSRPAFFNQAWIFAVTNIFFREEFYKRPAPAI